MMGYMPDSQNIKAPARQLIESIPALREAMMERIRDTSQYKEEHLAELRVFVVRLTQLEVDLLELAGG